jgi:hydroxyacylglutathione hydrolase
MFFRQVIHDDLGCASYVIADGAEAAVIDPKWEIDDYLALADEHGYAITHIFETHNHADHLSGRGRLAAATTATIHVSADADVNFDYEPLDDEAVVAIGQAQIRALATPGHRPEHMAFVVEDASRGDEPWLLLTGDSLFVGDLARPDLAIEPGEGARGLYQSLRRLLELPDFVEIWPGHIGGSLCGGAGMSEKPLSTLGFERRFNRFLKIDDEQAFVRELTGEVQPQPPHFRRIVELNRGPLIEAAGEITPLAPARVQELVGAEVTLLDGRSPREFDGAHVAGSINVSMAKGAVGTRAAWVADPDDDVVAAAACDDDAHWMIHMLEAIGFRTVRGFLAGGIASWQEAGLAIETTPAVDVATLAERIRGNEVILLDVREEDEWQAGHVSGSLHVPYHDLRDAVPDEVREVADGKPLAIACSAGHRSSIAASLLKSYGIRCIEHVVDGGVQDLEEHGLELVVGEGAGDYDR